MNGAMRVLRGLAKGGAALALALGLGVGALWLAGPPPLETGPYLQSVSAHAAVIARIDRAPSRLVVTLQAEGLPALQAQESAPTREHALEVTGLAPDTRYAYRIEPPGAGGEGSFRTPPIDPDAPVRFAAVGDSGPMPWWFNGYDLGATRLAPLLRWSDERQNFAVASAIAAQHPDFFVHLGDIVYWPVHKRAAHEESFFRPFAPVLREAALYTVLGNHDIPEHGPLPFDTLFHNPASDAPRPDTNYAFTWGPVRVVVIENATGIWPGGTPLHAWVQRTLEASTQPFLVVAVHTPCDSAVETLKGVFQRDLCQLLAHSGVDLVISGDDHLYQRFRPREPGGPIQITAGGGGKSLYDFDPDHPTLESAAKSNSFLLVEVHGLELVGRALGTDGAELDRFRIDRSEGPLPDGIPPKRAARIEALRAAKRAG
jgi:Calcineurin-like phosphoesterase